MRRTRGRPAKLPLHDLRPTPDALPRLRSRFRGLPRRPPPPRHRPQLKMLIQSEPQVAEPPWWPPARGSLPANIPRPRTPVELYLLGMGVRGVAPVRADGGPIGDFPGGNRTSA